MPWNNGDRGRALDRAEEARTDHDAGARITTHSDGTVSVEFIDGAEDFSRVVFHPDGSRTIYDPNGHATYIPEGGVLTGNGVAVTLPDGTVREVEEDGDVVYTQPDGTPGGGFDAGIDATTVVHGDGGATTIWHGPGGAPPVITTDPPPPDDGGSLVDADFEAWIQAIEAAEAAAEDTVPEVIGDADLDTWIEELEAADAAALFDPSAAEAGLHELTLDPVLVIDEAFVSGALPDPAGLGALDVDCGLAEVAFVTDLAV
jgi:hypothetical protein